MDAETAGSLVFCPCREFARGTGKSVVRARLLIVWAGDDERSEERQRAALELARLE